jgi:hypothetical protein
MSTRKELRLLNSDIFEDYLELVCQELGLDGAKALPEGAGDLVSDKGLTSYAVRKSDHFAAFRWVELTSEQPMLFESFHVAPASKSAHSALLVRRWKEAATAETVTAESVTVEAVNEAFLSRWRQTVGGQTVERDVPIPGFMELATMLASQGQVSTTSAEHFQRAQILESELEYARIELAEMALELETAQDNLRAATRSSSDFESLIRPMFSGTTPGDAETGAQTTPDTGDDQGATGLESLPAWAADNAERIVILPRALNGAKKSQYQSPETIMKALEILAGPYREHRLGNIGLPQFEAALAAEGIQLQGSVGQSIAGSHGEQYFVQWGKRRRFLDLHLLKGGGREPRYCMRIYFFWDSETNRCVVGSMPAHLNNSLS